MPNLRPEEIILECRGCKHWRPNSYRIRCHVPKELKTDKNGKCLNKEKPKW